LVQGHPNWTAFHISGLKVLTRSRWFNRNVLLAALERLTADRRLFRKRNRRRWQPGMWVLRWVPGGLYCWEVGTWRWGRGHRGCANTRCPRRVAPSAPPSYHESVKGTCWQGVRTRRGGTRLLVNTSDTMRVHTRTHYHAEEAGYTEKR